VDICAARLLGTLVNRIILSAAAVFTVATAAHADEVSDIQTQSKSCANKIGR